jgi:hypothetical protein
LDMVENWLLHQLNTNYNNWTELPPPPFSHECTSASQSCSSTALDRTCCKWRQQLYPLATPFTGSYSMRFLSLMVR